MLDPSKVLHIYTRVSTAVQADEGMSLEIQKEIGVKRAKELGFVPKLWNEGAKSSNHDEVDKRPKLGGVLSGIRDGEIKHLFIYDQSRLSRNDQVASIFRYECNKNGVTLHTKDGKLDLSNPQDQFLKQIMDAVAQLDNAQRTERTRLGKLSRIRQGFWKGGPPPYGYEIDRKKLVIHENEAKWVRRVFEMYSNQISTMDIKSELDSNGILPRRKRGTWTIGSIQSLMRNTHYIGYWNYTDSVSGETLEIQCPRILNSTLWSKVQKAREFNRSQRTHSNPTKHFYLLKEIMHCGHCNSQMSGRFSSKQSINHYYCPKKERTWTKKKIEEDEKWKRGRVCTMTRSLNVSVADEAVWNVVVDTISKSSLVKEIFKSHSMSTGERNDQQSKEELKTLNRSLKRVIKEIGNVVETLGMVEFYDLTGKYSSEAGSKIKQRIKKRQILLESRKEGLEEQIGGLTETRRWIDWLGKFRKKISNYRNFSQEERKSFLQGIVKVIRVYLTTDRKHRIEIEFIIPMVGDLLQYEDSTDKSKGYKIQGGLRVAIIEQSFRKESKKKH